MCTAWRPNNSEPRWLAGLPVSKEPANRSRIHALRSEALKLAVYKSEGMEPY